MLPSDVWMLKSDVTMLISDVTDVKILIDGSLVYNKLIKQKHKKL